MDNQDPNRERDRVGESGSGQRDRTSNPSREAGQEQDQNQRLMADRTGGLGAGSDTGPGQSATDEDLQREGNLGNERNRNQPDRDKQTGSREDPDR